MKGRAQMILLIKKIVIKIASIIAVVALLSQTILSASNKNSKSDVANSNFNDKQSNSSFSTSEISVVQEDLPSIIFASMDILGMKNDTSTNTSSTSKCEDQLSKISKDSLTELMRYVLEAQFYDNMEIENKCGADICFTLTDDSTNSQLHIKPLSQSSALIEYSLYNSLIDTSNDFVLMNKLSESSTDLSIQDILYSFPEYQTESSNSSTMKLLDEIANTKIVFDDSSIEQAYCELITQINSNIQNMQKLKSSLTNVYETKSIKAPIIQAEISLCESNILQTQRMINCFKDNEYKVARLNSHLKELKKELRYLLLLQNEAKNNYIYNNYKMHKYQCLHEDYRQQFLHILGRCIELSPIQSYVQLQQIYEIYFNE